MKQKTHLTNERLKYKFKSFFDLVNFGIRLAKDRIAKEESSTLDAMIEILEELPDLDVSKR